jgi:hypothetical protein
VAGLRLRLYILFDDDVQLRDALEHFHGVWWARFGPQLRRLEEYIPDVDGAEQLLSATIGAQSAADYFQAIGSLAARSGLDRLPAVGSPPGRGFDTVRASGAEADYVPSGTAQIQKYLWHLDKAKLWEAAERNEPLPSDRVLRPTFAWLASFGTVVPGVDTSIADTKVRWDPRLETLAAARRRLRREAPMSGSVAEAELERIVEDGKFILPDTSSNLGRDAWFVWWRIRGRLTYEQIAAKSMSDLPGLLSPPTFAGDSEVRSWNREHPEEATPDMKPREAIDQVRKAVRTFARLAGVDVSTAPGRRPRDSEPGNGLPPGRL